MVLGYIWPIMRTMWTRVSQAQSFATKWVTCDCPADISWRVKSISGETQHKYLKLLLLSPWAKYHYITLHMYMLAFWSVACQNWFPHLIKETSVPHCNTQRTKNYLSSVMAFVGRLNYTKLLYDSYDMTDECKNNQWELYYVTTYTTKGHHLSTTSGITWKTLYIFLATDVYNHFLLWDHFYRLHLWKKPCFVGRRHIKYSKYTHVNNKALGISVSLWH